MVIMFNFVLVVGLSVDKLDSEFVIMVLKETCQSLCRLIVVAADNNTKQMLRLSLGDEQQRFLVTSLIEMLLVKNPLLFPMCASSDHLTSFTVLHRCHFGPVFISNRSRPVNTGSTPSRSFLAPG